MPNELLPMFTAILYAVFCMAFGLCIIDLKEKEKI